ncbi:MAG: hypothetical protein ACD_75C00372G0004 [uncultured bacterium]|nr:MAG: hypothetical protein ACD_75C00372G0004 [uncultured bacterium]
MVGPEYAQLPVDKHQAVGDGSEQAVEFLGQAAKLRFALGQLLYRAFPCGNIPDNPEIGHRSVVFAPQFQGIHLAVEYLPRLASELHFQQLAVIGILMVEDLYAGQFELSPVGIEHGAASAQQVVGLIAENRAQGRLIDIYYGAGEICYDHYIPHAGKQVAVMGFAPGGLFLGLLQVPYFLFQVIEELPVLDGRGDHNGEDADGAGGFFGETILSLTVEVHHPEHVAGPTDEGHADGRPETEVKRLSPPVGVPVVRLDIVDDPVYPLIHDQHVLVWIEEVLYALLIQLDPRQAGGVPVSVEESVDKADMVVTELLRAFSGNRQGRVVILRHHPQPDEIDIEDFHCQPADGVVDVFPRLEGIDNE